MNFNSLFFLCLILTGILFLVLSIIILLIRKSSNIDKKIKILDIGILSIASCAFGFLGISIGISMGLSNSPIVETIIPAILTFAGAFVSFLLIKSNQEVKRNSQFIAALGLIFLSYFIIKGLEKGVESRILYQETHEKDGSLRDIYQKEYNDTVISEYDKNYLDSLLNLRNSQ